MKKVIAIYFLIFVFFTIVYLSFFHTSLFSYQKVLFYRGIALLIFTTLIALLLALFCYFKWIKSHLESIIASIVMMFAVHLSIFVVFPVTFERSVTTYLLSVLRNNYNNPSCHGLTKPKLTEELINDYIIKKDAVAKRVEEQKIINFINTQGSCIQLTQRGLNFLDLSKIFKKIYGLNNL